jgi:glycerol kinase
VLVNSGAARPDAGPSLLASVAWMSPGGAVVYALEGSVFVTGAAVQWLRDGLGLLDNAAQSEALALSVPDSAGVVFVPALTGLGAPFWDPDARGAIFGITRGTSRAHLVRATLEAISYEVRDVCEAMAAASGGLRVIKADGGAAANNLLMQLQSDQLGVPVERPVIAETTALGAGFLAGLATGVWSSLDELSVIWQLDRRFEPGARDEAGYARWRAALGRSKGWAAEAPQPG